MKNKILSTLMVLFTLALPMAYGQVEDSSLPSCDNSFDDPICGDIDLDFDDKIAPTEENLRLLNKCKIEKNRYAMLQRMAQRRMSNSRHIKISRRLDRAYNKLVKCYRNFSSISLDKIEEAAL